MHYKALSEMVENFDYVLDDKGDEKTRMGNQITFKFKTTDRRRYSEALLFEGTFQDRVKVKNSKVLNVAGIQSYVLQTGQLGFINCDRFNLDRRAKTFINIPLASKDSVEMSLYFKNISSLMRGSVVDNSYRFANVPVGQEAVLVAIRQIKGGFEYSVSDIVCGRRIKMSPYIEMNVDELMASVETKTNW